MSSTTATGGWPVPISIGLLCAFLSLEVKLARWRSCVMRPTTPRSRALSAPAVAALRAARRRLRRGRRRRAHADAQQTPPVAGQSGDEVPATGPPLGFPVFATKNTTRVAGGDPIADAAGVALATYPARTTRRSPTAVILAEVRDWRTGLAASVLGRAPIRAPMLFSDGDKMPDATKAALDALQPTGAKEAGGAQVIRVGTKAPVEGYKTTDVAAANPAALAAAVDRLQAAAAGRALGRGRRRLRSTAPSTRCPPPAGRPSPATRCCG